MPAVVHNYYCGLKTRDSAAQEEEIDFGIAVVAVPAVVVLHENYFAEAVAAVVETTWLRPVSFPRRWKTKSGLVTRKPQPEMERERNSFSNLYDFDSVMTLCGGQPECSKTKAALFVCVG